MTALHTQGRDLLVTAERLSGRSAFAKDVLVHLGKRTIFGIKRNDLLDVIARIERRDALRPARTRRPGAHMPCYSACD